MPTISDAESSHGITGVHSPLLQLRVGMLLDHPSPHMVAFLDALANREDCAAQVIYCDQVAPGRSWGAPVGNLPNRFLPGITLPGGFRFNAGIVRALKQARADVWVINTVYAAPTTLLAAWWLDREKIPWAYFGEPSRVRGRLFSSVKHLPLRFMLRRASGAIGMGRRAEEFYRSLLDGNQPTASVPYYVELEEFYRLPLPTISSGANCVEFVTSCQMIKRKGLDVLLRACELLPENGWRLTLAGDGPLRRRLEKNFSERWKDGRVRFMGAVPYEQRASVFSGKHVFVFPSRWDGWGMVVPEALAAGLPVVATNHVSSAHEFIRNGQNGFVVPVNDPEALAEKMLWFIRNPESIPNMGLAARQSLKNYQPDIGVDSFIRHLSELANKTLRMSVKDQPNYVADDLTWSRLTTPAKLSRRSSFKLRAWAKEAIIASALISRPRKKANGHRILSYHLVLPEDKGQFEEQIRFLADHFRIGSVAEVVQAAKERQRNDEYWAAITFDDGFRVLMTDCLEVLEKFGVKASFYVPTGFVELSRHPHLAAQFNLRAHHYGMPLEPMCPEDLNLLVKLGHEIGSHGVSHVSFAAMSRKMVERELDVSRSRILEWTGKLPESFAYPYGERESSVVVSLADQVRRSGFTVGLTSRRGKVNHASDPFLLPREHAEGNWSIRDMQFFLLS